METGSDMGALLGNRILDALAPGELEMLRPYLTPTSLRAGATVHAREMPSNYLYFPLSGVVSVLAETADGESVEVALAGRDGMVGAFEALGQAVPPFTSRVQVEGNALRLPAPVFRRQMNECGELLTVVHEYMQRLMVQVSQSAVCNRFHTSEQRLARWLLATALTAGRDTLELTHDEIAMILGAPRSAITEAAAALREAGLVDYSRGRLKIVDRSGLERAACECYRILEGAIGSAPVPPPSGPPA
jgi:CRP-like cAMP-binding protein